MFNLVFLEKLLKGYPAFRIKQARQAIFVDLIDDWQKATTLPEDLREYLNKELPLDIKAEYFQSKNNIASKALFELSDGKKIEAVLMQHADNRNTVCLSSQVGCPLGCKFCATGDLGWERNLTTEEIIMQAIFFARLLKKENKHITNLVFMGMGEPFLNYDAVMSAIRFFNDQNTLNIGARHISISTVGLPDGIKKLADEPYQVNLAVSIHAPTNELRLDIIPINAKHSLESIISALKFYMEKTNRQVMIEYLLISKVNDSEQNAFELIKLLKDLPHKLIVINLITYNETKKYRPTPAIQIEKFKKILEEASLRVTRRYKFGDDINAACGQLAKNAK